MKAGVYFRSILLLMQLSGCNQVESLEQQVSGTVEGATKSAPGNGPFGLNLIAGPSNLNVNKSESTPDTGFYLLNSVPSPATEFETYGVVAFEDVGICEIRAVSETLDNDSLGVSARNLADSLATTLASKYGEAEKSDLCGGGSISCQNEFWAMSVMNGERLYAYQWQPNDKKIRTISLAVTSDNLARLSVRLDYEIGDERKCSDALNSVRAQNL